MSATAQLQSEQTEVEAVLGSGIFNRAPNLSRFFRYIAELHFKGESDRIKEYCIATEALGRPVDFDQKKDSIVRVEAHRLRKRLAEYYAGPGADHAVHIEIPHGQYALQFTHRAIGDPEPVLDLVPVAEARSGMAANWPATALTIPATTPGPPKSRRVLLGSGLAVAGLAAATFAWGAFHRPQIASREVWEGSSAEPVESEFRMIAGYHGTPFTDRQGRVWQPDAYFDGGKSMAIPPGETLEGLPDPGFARTYREGQFSYAIPVRDGNYEVHLYFLQPKADDPSDPSNTRLFRVVLNNGIVLDQFDPLSQAGAPDRLHGRVFRDVMPAKDGKIHIRMQPYTGNPVLNAIEILSTRPGGVRPVRIVAAKSSVTDSEGAVWMADQHYIGGWFVKRNESVLDPGLKMLFQGEHYGNFSYRIPEPAGRYQVRLFFAETYFGSKLQYANQAALQGARLFNVFANGVALLDRFDVSQEAGGPNRIVVKTFNGLEPNAQGQIVLDFVPVRNYAEVNAIEVTLIQPRASTSPHTARTRTPGA